jgi:hypothetical protein
LAIESGAVDKVAKSTLSKGKKGAKNKANTKVASFTSTDPFVGKVVAFGCSSEFGKKLLKEFGKKWVDYAICYHLDAKNGHLVGTVMQRSRGLGKNSMNQMNYDVVWEFSSLDETNIPYSHLLGGNKLAEKLLRKRAKMKYSIDGAVCGKAVSRKGNGCNDKPLGDDKIKK